MPDKPFTLELTPEGMELLRKTVESHPTIERLRQTQDAILHILKNSTEIGKYRSSFREREQIKTTDSIIEKINDHRRDGEADYDLRHLRDVIGAQIICPYTDDVKAIIDWLYCSRSGQEYFVMIDDRSDVERRKQAREAKTGYRAYHVCLKLTPSVARARKLPDGSENEPFELQIKTALDAGWDFQTHDINYKAANVPPELRDHLKLISDTLGSIDKQTLLLRDSIIREKKIQGELREAACRLIFYRYFSNTQRVALGIDAIRIEQRRKSDIDTLERTLCEYFQSHGIDRIYVMGLALLALCRDSRLRQEQALSYASYLVKQAEEKGDQGQYILSLRMRALLRWAFHKTKHAVNDIRFLMQVTKETRDVNDYIYYVGELYEPSDKDTQLARKCVKKIKLSDNPENMDTLGAFYIHFGENVDELRYGLNLVREAKSRAQGTDLGPVLDAFCSYHEYIFLRQLSKLPRVL